eukprot:NODE_11713_length_251_cov_33.712871_g9943_i0.p1 GENE.NODE_11713_length_251_cov_33.712871_g9943_i0~~NODE_11713_length_251_cov_33.712871_g9943_i0.p1  ORF type:complete len:62 (+),score=19.19 NODE_11713_length_251_cov_33.712871_g9943_i0:32-187(+)
MGTEEGGVRHSVEFLKQKADGSDKSSRRPGPQGRNRPKHSLIRGGPKRKRT